MKKTVLLLIVFSALINSVHAQTSGGPDAYGYIWRTNLDAQGPAYNWIDLTSNPEAVQVTGLGDDNFVGPFSLVAPFHYYWYDINSFYIGSNGYLAVNGGLIASSASGFPTIPSSSGVNNYIGAFVTDFTFAGPGNIGQCYYYQSADSDSLIVSWVNVPFWQQPAPTWTGSNSYQIILNRLDSSIVMQYETQNGVSSALGNTIEIGIENNSGAVGLEYLSSTYPSVTTAVKYIYPTTTLFQVNDASTSFCDNPSNGGIFLIKNGASFTMGAGFKNTGNTNLATFNVSAEVQDAATNIVVRDTQTIASLNTNAFQFVAFADPFIPDTEGVFSMNCFTLLPADATPTNDLRTLEINVVDASQTNIELSYDEGNSSGGLSWNGGNGGIANYFIPPFYPCNLTQVKEWIVSDANNVGFSMMIFDDDGINGAPLTVLDSINEVGGSFITGGFVTTNLTTPIRIDSGGFYVLWYMGGTNIQVGRNQVPPFSFRTYEILGTPTGANFSPYRDIETEDFMIRAVIQHIGVGINELKEGELFSQFYPNPANDKVSINFDPGSTSGSLVTYQLFDLSGKLIQGETVSSVKRKIEINVKGFNSGIYICKFKVGNTEVNRKLTIVK